MENYIQNQALSYRLQLAFVNVSYLNAFLHDFPEHAEIFENLTI